MSKRSVVTAVLAGALAVAVMLHQRRRPRVWIGLHLADGMLITLGPDEPEAPALRSSAGELIRELRPAPVVGDVIAGGPAAVPDAPATS